MTRIKTRHELAISHSPLASRTKTFVKIRAIRGQTSQRLRHSFLCPFVHFRGQENGPEVTYALAGKLTQQEDKHPESLEH